MIGAYVRTIGHSQNDCWQCWAMLALVCVKTVNEKMAESGQPIAVGFHWMKLFRAILSNAIVLSYTVYFINIFCLIKTLKQRLKLKIDYPVTPVRSSHADPVR